MSFKSLALVAAFSFCAFSGGAHAAEKTWTITLTGHVNQGYDYTGVFGAAGKFLNGLSYTQTITASTDISKWGNFFSDSGARSLYGSGPAFTTTVSIKEVTLTYSSLSTFSGRQALINGVSNPNTNFDIDSMRSDQYGITANGEFLQAIFSASSYTPFVPTLNFGQSIPLITTAGKIQAESSFEIDGSQRARFLGNVDSFSISTTAVPEPETYAMLLAGLGLMGFMARRKRMAA
jgi:hypothetical protein